MKTALLTKGPRLPTGRAVCGPNANVPMPTTADALYDLTLVFTPGTGVIFLEYRLLDFDNEWYIAIIGTGVLSLQEYVAGVPITRAATGEGAVTGTHRLQVLVRGNEHRCYLDGVLQWVYADPSFIFGGLGGVAWLTTNAGANITAALSYPPPVYLVPPA